MGVQFYNDTVWKTGIPGGALQKKTGCDTVSSLLRSMHWMTTHGVGVADKDTDCPFLRQCPGILLLDDYNL